MNGKNPAGAPFELTFLGANSTVTRSRHLVQAGNARILIDCGLFQGYKTLRLRNWAPFPKCLSTSIAPWRPT